MIKILAILGKSGSGKTTLANQLERKYYNEMHIVKSYTTRAVREHDLEGDLSSHQFTTTERFYDDKRRGIVTNEYHSPKGYISWTNKYSFKRDKINVFVISAESYELIASNKVDFGDDKDVELQGIYLDISESLRAERWLNREGNLRKFTHEAHLGLDVIKTKEHLTVIDEFTGVELNDKFRSWRVGKNS